MADPILGTGGCSMQEPFALQVLGDQMEPEFPDGCIVLIEPSNQCRSGMFIFVEVEDVRWFRQYIRGQDGTQTLIALNDLYPEIDLEGLEWKVLGVIIQRNVRRKVKHYDYQDDPPNPGAPITKLHDRP